MSEVLSRLNTPWLLVKGTVTGAGSKQSDQTGSNPSNDYFYFLCNTAFIDGYVALWYH